VALAQPRCGRLSGTTISGTRPRKGEAGAWEPSQFLAVSATRLASPKCRLEAPSTATNTCSRMDLTVWLVDTDHRLPGVVDEQLLGPAAVAPDAITTSSFAQPTPRSARRTAVLKPAVWPAGKLLPEQGPGLRRGGGARCGHPRPVGPLVAVRFGHCPGLWEQLALRSHLDKEQGPGQAVLAAKRLSNRRLCYGNQRQGCGRICGTGTSRQSYLRRTPLDFTQWIKRSTTDPFARKRGRDSEFLICVSCLPGKVSGWPWNRCPCSWNECPDQRGITVPRMCVEWVSESQREIRTREP